ncbi:ribonuclease R [bacterium]|nr:ribonuclease R [bacterium]
MSPKNLIDEEILLEYINAKSERPVAMKDIAGTFKISKNNTKHLKKILNRLVNTGQVYMTRQGLYGPAEKLNLISGEFDAHRDGYGFVLSEVKGERDLFVPARKTMTAMNGDRVVARVDHPEKREGSIIKILERGQTKIIGKFSSEKNYLFVVPKNKSIPFGIIIAPEDRGEAQNGDSVVVEITSYPTENTPPGGKILRVLPEINKPLDEIETILEEYSLPRQFPRKILAEVDAISEKISAKGREDFRSLTTVTIDGETAKDFDDAVSIRKDKDIFILHVHIADVSHYVQWDTPLDLEARSRGTSVYFPGNVIPMLPEGLSNNLCSLVPKQDRLTMTAEMHFDTAGSMVYKKFFRSIINSNERMTYTSVKKILVDNDPEEREKYSGLIKTFELMNDLRAILSRVRNTRGSLDFDLPEPEVVLDLQGIPEAIILTERNIAHMIIEEFMIAANEAVSSYIEGHEIPSLYRIHEKPDNTKLDELMPIFKTFNLQTKKTGHRAFQEILKKTKGTPEETILNILLLRSLKQAKYSTENLGHFGLASESYTHFTSPIRRYPDLVIHRILKKLISEKGISDSEKKGLASILPDIAVHSSKTERTAEEAERSIVNTMRIWYMKDKIGQRFPGIVTGITSHGLKIRLRDIYIEGYIHVSSMNDDYYKFDEKAYLLVGRRKKRSFKLGQEVSVKVDRIDMEEKSIILSI